MVIQLATDLRVLVSVFQMLFFSFFFWCHFNCGLFQVLDHSSLTQLQLLALKYYRNIFQQTVDKIIIAGTQLLKGVCREECRHC